MSQRVGRKPLSTAHVDHLYGSTRAKDRLRIFLETLRGTLTIPEACQLLELSEAQFHHARHKWLQESLELLEPRRVGRPPKQEDPAELTRQCARLEAEIETLRSEVQGAQVREEIARR
jgi:transposase-like protein